MEINNNYQKIIINELCNNQFVCDITIYNKKIIHKINKYLSKKIPNVILDIIKEYLVQKYIIECKYKYYIDEQGCEHYEIIHSFAFTTKNLYKIIINKKINQYEEQNYDIIIEDLVENKEIIKYVTCDGRPYKAQSNNSNLKQYIDSIKNKELLDTNLNKKIYKYCGFGYFLNDVIIIYEKLYSKMI